MNITPADAIILALTDIKERIDAMHTAWAIYITTNNEHGKSLIETEMNASFDTLENMLDAIEEKLR